MGGLVRRALGLLAAAFTLSALASTARAADGALQIVADDRRAWDAIVREVQDDPATVGRTYALTVVTWGSKLACGEYHLALDEAGARAFSLGACDGATRATPLHVLSREALFEPGDVVPRPRVVTIHATRTESVTATGGADGLTTGSRVGCSVWLEPYAWDALRGVAVALPSDRFELRPLDEQVHAAPDGAGWIARGESHMAVVFRYEVVDRKTGRRVTDNVARLACDDAPASSTPATSRVVDEPVSVRVTKGGVDADRGSSGDDAAPFTLDSRYLVVGFVFGHDPKLQTAGMQLEIDRRVADRVWLGGSATALLAVPLGEADGVATGLQLGPSLRYLLGRNDLTDDWLGARAGWEKRGGWDSASRDFVEGAWGGDLKTGRVALGMVVALGASVGDPQSGEGDRVESYLNLAFRVAVDL